MPTTVIVLPNSVQTFRPRDSELARVQDNILACVNPILSFLNGAFRQNGTPTLNYTTTTTAATIPARTAWNLMGPALVGAGTTAGTNVFTVVSYQAGANSGQPAIHWPQPYPGSIVAITQNLVGNLSNANRIPTTGIIQGSIAAIVLINGATTGAQATLSTTNPIKTTVTAAPGTYKFVAGDVLSFAVNTVGSCCVATASSIIGNTEMGVWVQYSA